MKYIKVNGMIKKRHTMKYVFKMAPAVGLEPTTLKLTVSHSTIELHRI